MKAVVGTDQMALIPPVKPIVIEPHEWDTGPALTPDEEMTLRRLRRVRPGSLSAFTFPALRIRGNPTKIVAGLHRAGYPVKRNKKDGEWYFWIEDEEDG